MSSNASFIPKVVKLTPDIKMRLEQLGAIKDRSPHWLMQQAILLYLNQEEYYQQLNQETLARWQEAEQGKVVEHDDILPWLDTWGTDNKSSKPECKK